MASWSEDTQKKFTASKIIDLFKQGYTDEEVADELDVTMKEWNRMCERNPTFREVVERGREAAYAWNLRQSRQKLDDKDFNTTLFKIRMQNLHGWSDKTETANKNMSLNADVSKEELLKRLQSFGPELAKLGIEVKAPLVIEHNSEGKDE